MATSEEINELERAARAVASFNQNVLLEATLTEHAGGDFTIEVGYDDGRDQPWPITVHAVYNSVDEFESWAQKVDAIETNEERVSFIQEEHANYLSAVAVGHGDWHRGTSIIESNKNGATS